MSTMITLVRHGQSTGNAANCYTGQTDVALSQLGLQQAELTARVLAREPFSAIYASDLQRARVTAEAIARLHNLPVNTMEMLREIDLGEFQGHSFDEVAKKFPREFAALARKDLDVAIPGGESHRQVRDRVIKAFTAIINQHQQGNILFVVHGGVIFHINHYIFGISEDRYFSVTYKIYNCSIHRFELLEEDRWRVICLNDNAHLNELEIKPKATDDNPQTNNISDRLFGCAQ